jgi:monoamine oxidase
MMTTTEKVKIVIAGGGFAGLSAACISTRDSRAARIST